MKRHRNLKIFSAVGGAALVVWLAFVYNDPFWWSSFAALVVTIIAWRAVHSYKRRQFERQRRAVVEAVEQLFKNLQFFDEAPFLDRYSRFRFQTAVDHAAILGHALKTWVMDMQKQFDNGEMPRRGLKMSDVPALTEKVGMEVSDAFRYIKGGAKGKAPAILDDGWFDPVTIFGVNVAIFRTVEEENVFRPDHMKKPTPARHQTKAAPVNAGAGTGAGAGAGAAHAPALDARATEVIPPHAVTEPVVAPVVTPAVADGVEASNVFQLDQRRRKAKN